MTSKLFLTIFGLAAFVGYCFNRGHCAKTAKTEVKQEVGRWEGEGGNVPEVATPSPAPAPQSSYPDASSTLRH